MPSPTPLNAPAPGDEHVGVIYGNVGSTEFRFAVNDPNLKRLDYVKVMHETDGVVVAQVTDVTRESSLSHDDATQISGGYGVGGASDRLTASAKVIGYRDGRGLLQVPRTPFRAGELLYHADDGLIASVFGLRDRDGAFIGYIKGYELPVHLDINTLVQKHVSILAKTGSGKSYLVGVLMEELIKRGIPIVIVDPHGEHGSLARVNVNEDDYPHMRRFGVRPRSYAEHIIEYSPDTKVNPDALPLRLDGVNLAATDIAECLGGLTSTQLGMLHSAVRALAEEEDEYTLADVIERVKEAGPNSKWSLVSALENLIALNVFADEGTSIGSLVKRDKVSILNLKGVVPDVQELIVATVAKKLFEARKAGTVAPFMLVVEEAHNFCPERGVGSSLSSEILRTLASEGRKFGMGLLIVSQRPAKVDKNVLSQCNTQLMLKVTNPNDVKAITASVEGLTADMEGEIQRLPVGICVVSHPRIAMPILCEIRPRETSHGGESVDVMKSVQEGETFLAPRRPSAGSQAKAQAKAEAEDDDDEDDRRAVDVRGRAPPPIQQNARAQSTPTAPPPLAPAPQAVRAAAPPPPAAAPARPQTQLPVPPRHIGGSVPLPPWVATVRAEVEGISEDDVKRWDALAVRRLARELAERLSQLQALPLDHREEVADLVTRVSRLQAQAQERVDQAMRKRRTIFGRIFMRETDDPTDIPRVPKPPEPEAKRKKAKRIDLGAELTVRKVKARRPTKKKAASPKGASAKKSTKKGTRKKGSGKRG